MIRIGLKNFKTLSLILHDWFWLNFNFGDFRAYFGYFSLVKIDFFEIYFQSWRIKLRVLKFLRPILIIKRHQKNTQAKFFEKFASRQHALMARMSTAEFRSYQNYFALLISWKVIYSYSIQYFSPKAFSTPSSCDSRNLNLSPFCNTSSTSLAMWQPSVLETYGEEGKLDYLDKITGPMRKKYPNSTGDRELITSLTEVRNFTF